MRLALLASAAFCMTAGVAMAQTSMSTPAPTGAPNAAMSSPAPQASPGNMAPSSDAAASAASEGVNPAQSGGVTTSSQAAQTSPHYNGENSVSPPAGQANAGSATGGMMKTPMAYSNGAMAMPADADAGQYLKIASKAIKQHNKMLADDALSHAETRMLDRAVPASTGAQPDDSPAVTAIENARAALSSGDYQTAARDTHMAMHAHHGMMGGTEMSPMGDAGAESGTAQ